MSDRNGSADINGQGRKIGDDVLIGANAVVNFDGVQIF